MAVDVNRPVENPVLKGLLSDLSKASQEKKLDIFNKVAEEVAFNAHFLLVADLGGAPLRHNDDGTAVFSRGAQIKFPMLTAQGGEKFLPLFTDWDELRKWESFSTGDVSTIVVSFDDIYAMASKEKGPVVINPFGDVLTLPFDMLSRIKTLKDIKMTGVSPQIVKEQTPVKLGEPADYPRRMTDSIIAHAKRVKAIEAIWLKLMEKNGELSYLLVVDAKGDARQYFKGIADAAVPFLPSGMFVDMVPYTDRFGKSAATGDPFYRRKKGLFT